MEYPRRETQEREAIAVRRTRRPNLPSAHDECQDRSCDAKATSSCLSLAAPGSYTSVRRRKICHFPSRHKPLHRPPPARNAHRSRSCSSTALRRSWRSTRRRCRPPTRLTPPHLPRWVPDHSSPQAEGVNFAAPGADINHAIGHCRRGVHPAGVVPPTL